MFTHYFKRIQLFKKNQLHKTQAAEKQKGISSFFASYLKEEEPPRNEEELTTELKLKEMEQMNKLEIFTLPKTLLQDMLSDFTCS